MKITSWDANVFLCLVEWGLPEDVVKDSGMWKLVKKINEDFVRVESLDYYCNLARHILYMNKFLFFPSLATQELKAKWKWRCPERRRNDVVRWSKSDKDWNCLHIWKKESSNPGKGSSSSGYWNSGEAWSYSIEDRKLDTSEWEGYEEAVYFDMKEIDRRKYVSDWYKNIHEGRYFLFFKENDILSSDVYDKYRDEEHSTMAISELGDRWQTAQDLLTIDGGGLDQKPGNHIEHLDDLF